MTQRRFISAIWLITCLTLDGAANGFAAPQIDSGGGVSSAQSDLVQLAQAQPAPAPQTPAAPAAAAPSPAATAAADEPIGNVATLTGNATVTRNNAATPLKVQDDIFQNDVLQTSANSTLGVTFNDATTFNLTASARITVDHYVYEDGGKQNAALFDIVKGTVAFAAASVAKTGDMRIATPTATLGIRGTTGLVEVPEGAAANNANNVAIKLYPDADGRVGQIEISDRSGARLGSLTQGASGFTIRPGAGGRFSAVPLAISPQQALRDQGIVRQVHAAQNVGRQIVSQQRALRQANPNRNNLRNNPARQPGLQRQNGQPQRQGLPREPGVQNRPGQVPPPAGVQRPPNAPGVQQRQPNAPGVQRPGLQNRPALQRRPPPKEKKERR
ncbi:FecR family protein [Bradyrhizobium canariense]|uniref:FecR family protein n=1 Tax=Bradyrhizobium canariense TaxID=255045 RepID=A0A1H1VYF3_9BRAD|nr:FecR domain-containing protein [Bradyrhizobium canariense]SDS89481.1 FecR family protein [Bradyrhizobium canariense]